MLDYNDLLKIIKKAASDSVNAADPSDLIFGTVTKAPPNLEIEIHQRIKLPKEALVLTRNVTDFETEVTIAKKYGWVTQPRGGGAGAAAFSSHDHDIAGKWKIMVNNKLKVGETVALIKKAGGQRYVVLDRVVGDVT